MKTITLVTKKKKKEKIKSNTSVIKEEKIRSQYET